MKTSYECCKGKVEKYQKWLGLQDWRIELVVNCSPDDMLLKNETGECILNEVLKKAVIHLLDPQYANFEYDIDKTIIHEMLHIKFALFDNNENDLHDRLLHQTIDDLAKAFVYAEKKKK